MCIFADLDELAGFRPVADAKEANREESEAGYSPSATVRGGCPYSQKSRCGGRAGDGTDLAETPPVRARISGPGSGTAS
jgi:hypothetical protein